MRTTIKEENLNVREKVNIDEDFDNGDNLDNSKYRSSSIHKRKYEPSQYENNNSSSVYNRNKEV